VISDEFAYLVSLDCAVSGRDPTEEEKQAYQDLKKGEV
jgi:hypothetical protein